MAMTVITTVETETSSTNFSGADVLVTGTGGLIDTNGTALVFTDTTAVNEFTIEAGGLVFGSNDGIDVNANSVANSASDFQIDGTVQGNGIGMSFFGAGSSSASVVVGAQGSVSGGNTGILIESENATIANYGLISSEFGAGISAGTGAEFVTIANGGTIAGGINLGDAAGITYLTNSGLIGGGVDLPANAEGIINNSGAIEGELSSGPDSQLTNSGSIIGLAMGEGSNIVDTGSISATVSLQTDCAITIGRQGSVTTANGSVGIYVYATSSGQIVNHGLIGSGIAAASDSTDVSLTNTGIIDSGVSFIESGSDKIINSGTIDGKLTLGQSDFVYNTGIIHNSLVGNGDDTIENDGTIASGLNLTATGNDVVTNAGKIDGGVTLGQGDSIDTSDKITGGITTDQSAITNSGIIAGGITTSAGGDNIDNLGTISGGIADHNIFLSNSGTIDGGISVYGTNVLINTGTIAGGVSFNGSGDTVENDGTIHGSFHLGATDDVTNAGSIKGAVTMGTGDVFDTNTGSVTGVITATTSDTFDFNGNFGHYRIADFATAGTTHDILSFAADDFTSYSELQSHMAQVGADVVITLDGNDDIILLHIKLTALVSHDFAFT